MKRNTPILRRYFSSFDIFDRIKDSNANGKNGVHINENEESKRKPSKKVLKLVDEILNLTLVEAADLCDLCQEKLEGSKNFHNSFLLNRTPFPHPSSFFAQTLNPTMINGQAPMNMNQSMSMNQVNNQNNNIQKEENESQKNTGPVEEKKTTKNTFNVKMEKFDVKNKINTIKEIRKITNVGLKEAKEMVESAPFYISKGLPQDKADEIKKTFEDLGATIVIE